MEILKYHGAWIAAFLLSAVAVFYFVPELRPLAIGAEELTRWDTVTLANKNAMFFMQLIAVCWWGLLNAKKSKTRRAKIAWATTGFVLMLVFGSVLQFFTPFGVRPT